MRVGRAGRRVRVAAAAAVLLVALVAAAVIVTQTGSPTPARAGTGIPAGYTTTTVERRTLVEHATVDGTLGYGASLNLYNRLAGTFTWLPAVGNVVSRGGTLYKIDNRPVVLMYGPVPAYRALKEGVGDGPDVAELNANLIDLGYSDGEIVAGEDFGAGTAAAVRRWQKAEGLPQTGEVQLGRVIFAPSARRITSVTPTVGEDPPPSASPSANEPTAEKPASEKPASEKPASEKPASEKPATEKPASEKPASEKSKAKEPSSKKPQSSKPKAKKPAASEGERSKKEPEHEKEREKEHAKEKPASEANKGNGGEGAAPAVVLGTTDTQQLVQLQVKATEQQLARVGESVPVTLPGGSVVHGRITSVGTVASESSSSEKEKEKGGGGGGGGGGNESGNGENATIATTVTLDHPVARLDKAPVSVELVKSVRHNVLAVPATALVATAGGGYAIQVLEANRRQTLAVTPGMFANGYVQIEGAGVNEGMTVVEPQ